MRMIRRFDISLCTIGLLAIGLASCSTYDVVSPEDFKKEIDIVEDRECGPGDFATRPIKLENHVFESASDGDLAEGRFDDSFNNAFRTIMMGYAEEVKRSPNGHRPRLLFYFNGGLNSQGDVEHQAKRQVPCMLADGYYPVFFVWDTSGLAYL